MTSPEVGKVKLSDISFDMSVYPRKTHDPTLVQRYAESMESIETQNNFISTSKDLRLIDGRHRHLAYQTLYLDNPDHEIQVYVYPVDNDGDVFDLAAELNSDFGWQMTPEDKKTTAIQMYQKYNRTQDEIAKRLKIGKTKVSQWLQGILESEKKEREAKIWDMWLSCYGTDEIEKTIGTKKRTIQEFLQENATKFSENDSAHSATLG